MGGLEELSYMGAHGNFVSRNPFPDIVQVENGTAVRITHPEEVRDVVGQLGEHIPCEPLRVSTCRRVFVLAESPGDKQLSASGRSICQPLDVTISTVGMTDLVRDCRRGAVGRQLFEVIGGRRDVAGVNEGEKVPSLKRGRLPPEDAPE